MLTKWEDTYGIPVVSTGVTQIKAMRALGARKFAGITYFSGSINQIFTDYFTDAGFQVLAMAGMDVPFDRVQMLSSRAVYAHAKQTFLAHSDADVIYLMGGGWRTLERTSGKTLPARTTSMWPTSLSIMARQRPSFWSSVYGAEKSSSRSQPSFLPSAADDQYVPSAPTSVSLRPRSWAYQAATFLGVSL